MCALLANPSNKKIKIALMSLLLCLTVVGLKLWARTKKGLICITSGKKETLLLTVQNKTILIDTGGLPKRKDKIEQWIRFQLKPELVKERGRYTVDLLILQRKKESKKNKLHYEAERLQTLKDCFYSSAEEIRIEQERVTRLLDFKNQ
jgi:hypothetical protein